MLITVEILTAIILLILVLVTRLRKPKSHCLTVPTYVINMEGEKGAERREHFQKQAKKQNLKFEYWRATDKEKINFEKLLNDGEHLRKIDGHRPLTRGEIALSDSHKSVYSKIVEDGSPIALVFEDDVELCNDFVTNLQHVFKTLPEKFDIIKLEYCNEHIHDNGEIQIQPGEGGWCSAAYLISLEGAKHLIDCNTPIWMNSDGIMDNFHLRNIGKRELKLYHVNKPLARQVQGFQTGSHR